METMKITQISVRIIYKLKASPPPAPGTQMAAVTIAWGMRNRKRNHEEPLSFLLLSGQGRHSHSRQHGVDSKSCFEK